MFKGVCFTPVFLLCYRFSGFDYPAILLCLMLKGVCFDSCISFVVEVSWNFFDFCFVQYITVGFSRTSFSFLHGL